jgi:hypothetical protein
VAQNADVEACHERAREAGYHLKVTLEAAVGFAPLPGHEAPEPVRDVEDETITNDETPAFEVNASDRRFLRSLRIAADEASVEEAN